MNCRRSLCWVLLLPLLLVGCQGSEEITHYQVPRAKPRDRILPDFDVPADWKEMLPPPRNVKIAYRLPNNEAMSPEVTISALPGDGGGLLLNYRRWQGQLNLEPAAELPKDLKTIKVAGEDAEYIDLLGPEGKEQQRTLVIVCKHGEYTWYFKLKAARDVVAKNQTAFEAFVKSVRF